MRNREMGYYPRFYLLLSLAISFVLISLVFSACDTSENPQRENSLFDIHVREYRKDVEDRYRENLKVRDEKRVIFVFDEYSPIRPWDIRDFAGDKIVLPIKNHEGTEITLQEGDMILGWVDTKSIRSADEKLRAEKWVVFSSEITAVRRTNEKIIAYIRQVNIGEIYKEVKLKDIFIDFSKFFSMTTDDEEEGINEGEVDEGLNGISAPHSSPSYVPKLETPMIDPQKFDVGRLNLMGDSYVPAVASLAKCRKAIQSLYKKSKTPKGKIKITGIRIKSKKEKGDGDDVVVLKPRGRFWSYVEYDIEAQLNFLYDIMYCIDVNFSFDLVGAAPRELYVDNPPYINISPGEYKTNADFVLKVGEGKDTASFFKPVVVNLRKLTFYVLFRKGPQLVVGVKKFNVGREVELRPQKLNSWLRSKLGSIARKQVFIYGVPVVIGIEPDFSVKLHAGTMSNFSANLGVVYSHFFEYVYPTQNGRANADYRIKRNAKIRAKADLLTDYEISAQAKAGVIMGVGFVPYVMVGTSFKILGKKFELGVGPKVEGKADVEATFSSFSTTEDERKKYGVSYLEKTLCVGLAFGLGLGLVVKPDSLEKLTDKALTDFIKWLRRRYFRSFWVSQVQNGIIARWKFPFPFPLYPFIGSKDLKQRFYNTKCRKFLSIVED